MGIGYQLLVLILANGPRLDDTIIGLKVFIGTGLAVIKIIMPLVEMPTKYLRLLTFPYF
jgi:hypothetical protein